MNGLRITSHLATTPTSSSGVHFSFDATIEDENKNQDQPIGDVADDDVTLESLPEEEEDSAAPLLEDSDGDEGSINGEEIGVACSPLEGLSERAAAHLLQECIRNDPSKTLNEYYQKNGISRGLKSAFQEFAWEMPKGPPYWRFEFHCPMDGAVHRSGLPGPLLDEDPDQSLLELGQSFVGLYEIVGNRQVVFATKRGAKRSVALATLLDLGLINVPKDSGSPVTSVGPRKLHRLPKWVDQLYKVGVRGPNLKIHYREEFQGKSDWECEPTLLRCVLEIERPVCCTVEGSPEPSKPLAREAAVRKLVDEFRHRGIRSEDASASNSSDLEAKKRLLLCDPKQVSYVFPLPTWANCPAPLPEKDKVMLYVYELEFVTEGGNSFVSERTGLCENVTTPLGIVFMSDVQSGSKIETFESRQFSVPANGKKGSETVVVRLSKRTILNLSDLEDARTSATVADRIHWIKDFNRKLHRWKTYGMVGAANKIPRKGSAQTNKETDCFSPLDRTYCFVPLTRDLYNPIDWVMLERVASFSRMPYLQSIDDQWCVNLDLASYLLALLSLVFLAPGLYGFAKEYFVCEQDVCQYRRMEPWESLSGCLVLAVSVLAAVCRFVLPPKKRFSAAMLENRFLVQAGASNAIYITCRNKTTSQAPLTGKSTFLSDEAKANLSLGKIEYNKRKFNLNLATATFKDYYERKYGTVLQHPNEALLSCSVVTAHADNDMILSTPNDAGTVWLAPELVYILPMPRDVLYICIHAKTFMPLLEREIQVTRASDVMYAMTDGFPSKSLGALVKEATTLAPRSTYQRLEFIGDSVLGFFVAVVLMAGNSSMRLSFDDLGDIFVHATRNIVLHDAALRIGAHRLLHTSQQKWRSAYSPASQSNELHHREEISDSILSDVVESLLGATFVQDTKHKRDPPDKQKHIAVSIFRRLQLPISGIDSTEEQSFCAYDALEPCLKHGYSFDKDVAWRRQVIAIGHVLDGHQDLPELEAGRKHLIDILFERSQDDAICRLLQTPISRILVLQALLNTESTTSDSTSELGEVDMQLLSNFRDMMSLIGAYALQLCITKDLALLRYPEANEGDMHVMRACALNDDAVVYIMMKAGIHNMLVNIDPDSIKSFQLEMMVADSKGAEVWRNRGGWILEGGVKEYTRRCVGPNAHSLPMYPGLAGRLYGHKTKLPPEITYDLMFAMKAVVGALVLSVGVDTMWRSIGPLFEEALLLSAEELKKEYPHLSNIIA